MKLTVYKGNPSRVICTANQNYKPVFQNEPLKGPAKMYYTSTLGVEKLKKGPRIGASSSKLCGGILEDLGFRKYTYRISNKRKIRMNSCEQKFNSHFTNEKALPT